VSTVTSPLSELRSPLSGERRTPLTPHRLLCRECGADYPAAPTAICEACLGPLEPLWVAFSACFPGWWE